MPCYQLLDTRAIDDAYSRSHPVLPSFYLVSNSFGLRARSGLRTRSGLHVRFGLVFVSSSAFGFAFDRCVGSTLDVIVASLRGREWLIQMVYVGWFMWLRLAVKTLELRDVGEN